MDWERILISFTGIFVSSMLMYFVKKGVGKEAVENVNGDLVLALHKIYLYLGVVMVSLTLFFIVIALCYSEAELLVVSMCAVFLAAGMAAICLLYYYNHKLVIHSDGFTVYNCWGKPVRLIWKEVEKAKVNPLTHNLVVRALNKKVSISTHFIGIKQFVKMLEEQSRIKPGDLKFPF